MYVIADFILLIQFILLSGSHAAPGCEIDPFVLDAPLLIRSGESKIIYPLYGESTVKFATNETIEFSCPQKIVLVDGKETRSIVQATCISNQRFRVEGSRFLWRQITCSDNPISFSRFISGTCGTNARLAEIGFQLDEERFLRTSTVCFNTKTQNTLWSQNEVPANIAVTSTTPRPFFSQDEGFYTFDVNTFFLRNRQRRTINRLVGLNNTSTKYIQAGATYFLSRGHLCARSDYVYAAQKNATFKYINVAPQWQSFNGRNWAQAEIDTRSYASSRNVSLQVWTGTYGIATLPHETTGKQVDLYLYENNGLKLLPVPALYWKLAYNPVNKKGVVLIGHNNPYQTGVAKDIICNDVSSKVTWLNWDKTNIQRGYSYACDLASFRKVVAFAPNPTITGLLV